jgi:hypothetical protein
MCNEPKDAILLGVIRPSQPFSTSFFTELLKKQLWKWRPVCIGTEKGLIGFVPVVPSKHVTPAILIVV